MGLYQGMGMYQMRFCMQNVQSLGELLGFARCRSHQHRYCDLISSLRLLEGGGVG